MDLSNKAHGRARRNLRLNGLGGTQHELVRSDVTRWLSQVRGRKWDLAVLETTRIHGRSNASTRNAV